MPVRNPVIFLLAVAGRCEPCIDPAVLRIHYRRPVSVIRPSGAPQREHIRSASVKPYPDMPVGKTCIVSLFGNCALFCGLLFVLFVIRIIFLKNGIRNLDTYIFRGASGVILRLHLFRALYSFRTLRYPRFLNRLRNSLIRFSTITRASGKTKSRHDRDRGSNFVYHASHVCGWFFSEKIVHANDFTVYKRIRQCRFRCCRPLLRYPSSDGWSHPSIRHTFRRWLHPCREGLP